MLTATNITLKELFRQAYRLKPYQLAGGPAWLETEAYDVIAKSETKPSSDELRVMLRNLLAERFRLTFHRENKEVQVMALVVSRSGPKFREAPLVNPAGKTGPPATSMGQSAMFMRLNMENFTNILSGSCGTIAYLPVVDKTGLQGIYDLRMQTGRPAPPEPGTAPRTPFDLVCEALPDQLGLELKRQKAPVEICDRARRETFRELRKALAHRSYIAPVNASSVLEYNAGARADSAPGWWA